MTLGRPDYLCFQLKIIVYVACPQTGEPHKHQPSAENTDSLALPVSWQKNSCQAPALGSACASPWSHAKHQSDEAEEA